MDTLIVKQFEKQKIWSRGLSSLLYTILLLISGLLAQAQDTTYTWTGQDGIRWSTAGNWDSNEIPVSSVNTDVVFSGYTGNDSLIDIDSSLFDLHQLTFDSGIDPFILEGGQIKFSQDSSSAAPILEQDSASAIDVGLESIVLNQNLTIQGAGTGPLSLTGIVSGAGGLIQDSDSTVILNQENTYGGGTIIESSIVQVSSQENLGFGGITLAGGELLTTATGSIAQTATLNGSGILAAATGTTATYDSFNGTGRLTVGDETNTGTVNLDFSGGFSEIGPTLINVVAGTRANFFGYIGQSTTIRGNPMGTSSLGGFAASTANGSATPLFIYNPANENASGAVANPTDFIVTVNNLTITGGLSQGGSGISGGAGLGGGAFVGAGATLALNNVVISGNSAIGGGIDLSEKNTAGGGLGGNSVGNNGGGLFGNGETPSGTDGGFGAGGGGSTNGGTGGFGGGGGYGAKGGFGGGGSDASGGVGGTSGFGAGLGGGIFVQNEASVLITGNSTISGNVVSVNIDGPAATAGSDIFMMTGSTVTLAPGNGNMVTIGSKSDDQEGNNDVADDSVYGLPGYGYYTPGSAAGAALTIGGGSSSGGTVVLHGYNTYAGGTSIDSNTTLEVFQDYNLGAYDSTNSSIGTISLSSGGELLTDGPSGSFSTNRLLFLGTGGSTLAAVTDTTAIYSGVISGNGALTVGANGQAGKVMLRGSNTYRGGTTVAAGFLAADATSGSSTGIGKVTVDNGGILGGSGIIAPTGISSGAAIEIEAGGTLSPSNGIAYSYSHLTVNLNSGATLLLGTNSKLVFNIGDNTADSDEVLLTGGLLNLHNQTISDFTFNTSSYYGYGFEPGTYTLIDSTAGITGSLSGATTEILDGYQLSLVLDNDNHDLDLQVENYTANVPEPSTLLLFAAGFVLIVVTFRGRLKFSH